MDVGNIGAQIERLTRQGDGKLVEIDGVEYSTTPLHDPRKPEHIPETVVVHTLQGLADLVKGDDDEAYREIRGLFVHVESPTQVRLCTGIFGPFNQRAVLATAMAIVPPLQLGQHMDQETFVVHVLCAYEPTEARDRVLKLAGNLTSEAVQTLADDGVTQRATARAGLVKVANVEVENPVELRPYRSFGEVEQVDSPFILRLRGGGGDRPPTCALFECDGGRWRLEAIQRVKAWLLGELPGVALYG